MFISTNQLRVYYLLSFALLPLLAPVFTEILNLKFYSIWGFFALILAGLSIVNNPKSALAPRYFIVLALLGIYYFVSEFRAGYIDEIGLSKYIYRSWVPALMAVIFLIHNTIFSEKQIENLIKVFKLTLLLSATATIIQLFFDRNFLSPSHTVEFLSTYEQNITITNYRNLSIFGYADDHDLGWALVSITLIVLNWCRKRGENLYPYLGMALISLIGSNNRWMMVGGVILLIYTFWYKGISFKTIFGILFISVAFVQIGISFLAFHGLSVEEYLLTRLLSESANSRLDAFDDFAHYFPQKPIFGYGLEIREYLIGGVQLRPKMHVGYLSHLVGYGMVGTGLLLSFWTALSWSFYKTGHLIKDHYMVMAFGFFLLANWTMPHYSIFNYGYIFLMVFNKYEQDLAKGLVPKSVKPLSFTFTGQPLS